MNRMNETTKRTMALAALVLGLTVIFGASGDAHAAGKIFIGGSVGGDHSHSYYVPGHYETRTETVMVESAHYEKVWVADQYKTVTLSNGTQLTVKVADGYWNEVYVPARYETRAVQVWVPGYYVERHHQSRPRVGIGFGFRF